MAWLEVTDKTTRSGFGALTGAVAAVSSKVGPARPRSLWYRRLCKPPFQPAVVFPVVWSALYASLAESGFRVWRARPSKERDRALRWWLRGDRAQKPVASVRMLSASVLAPRRLHAQTRGREADA